MQRKLLGLAVAAGMTAASCTAGERGSSPEIAPPDTAAPQVETTTTTEVPSFPADCSRPATEIIGYFALNDTETPIEAA